MGESFDFAYDDASKIADIYSKNTKWNSNGGYYPTRGGYDLDAITSELDEIAKEYGFKDGKHLSDELQLLRSAAENNFTLLELVEMYENAKHKERFNFFMDRLKDSLNNKFADIRASEPEFIPFNFDSESRDFYAKKS